MSTEIEVTNYLLNDFLFRNEIFATFTFAVEDMVQSLLQKDTLSRTYLTSLQLVTGTVWRR